MNLKKVLIIILIILLLIFLFPKKAGYIGESPTDDDYECRCLGIKYQTTTMIFDTYKYCLGIPFSCEYFNK